MLKLNQHASIISVICQNQPINTTIDVTKMSESCIYYDANNKMGPNKCGYKHDEMRKEQQLELNDVALRPVCLWSTWCTGTKEQPVWETRRMTEEIGAFISHTICINNLFTVILCSGMELACISLKQEKRKNSQKNDAGGHVEYFIMWISGK